MSTYGIAIPFVSLTSGPADAVVAPVRPAVLGLFAPRLPDLSVAVPKTHAKMAVLSTGFIRLLLTRPFTTSSPQTFALTAASSGTLVTPRRQHFWDAASILVTRAMTMAVLPVL